MAPSNAESNNQNQDVEPSEPQIRENIAVSGTLNGKPPSESFKNNSAGDEQAAVVVLQKAARGMNGRSTTKHLVASKQASEELLNSLDSMLSPTENATRLLEDMLTVIGERAAQTLLPALPIRTPTNP